MSTVSVNITDITKLNCDCIVNAANSRLKEGGGVCGAIFKAAGSKELAEACDAIGGCSTGSAVITSGFNLKAKYIIHTVGPKYIDGEHDEASQLYECYNSSLELAKENEIHSIAFPLISSGIYGYPIDDAWDVAVEACYDFINQNDNYDIDIIFAVRNEKTAQTGRMLIDERIEMYNSRPSSVFSGTNKNIEDAIDDWYKKGQNFFPANIFDMIAKQMKYDMEVLVPLIKIENTNDDEAEFNLQMLQDEHGIWIPAFTSKNEFEKGEKSSVGPQLLKGIIEVVLADERICGIVLNPFGNSLCIPKGECQILIDMQKPLTQDELDLNAGADAYRKGDFVTAVEMYTKAASAGNVTALSNLGYCHYYGRSIPVDKKKARDCWERAAMLGDIASVYKLGDMYRNGDLEPDIEFSHALYKRAFYLAQFTDDNLVYPDAYLRMLRYYPEEIENIDQVMDECYNGILKRIEQGDNYSEKVFKEVAELKKKYCKDTRED